MHSYLITNNARGPRFLPRPRGGPVLLSPRESKKAELDDAVAEAARRAQLRGGLVHLEPVDEDGAAVLARAEQRRPPRGPFKIVGGAGQDLEARRSRDGIENMMTAASLVVDELAPGGAPLEAPAPEPQKPLGPSAPTAAQALLAQAPELPLGALQRQARELLGRAWPGGRRTRREVETLLTKAVQRGL